MRKMLVIVACLTLVFALQAGAGVTTPSTYSPELTAVDNGKAPDRSVNATDETLYLEDFEAGQGDWTFVDVTAAGIQWHTDSFNAYAGNSWWCGDPALGGYDNHWLQYLVSPSLDFSAATNPVLTFKMFYAVEAPGGEPAPYDGWDGCNVWASINGGVTWTPIMPTFPAYTCTSMYSFGFEWGMGPNIPGWGATSGGWVDASFNLSTLAGQADVMVRFAFCSDPAWCTIDDPSLIGFFVDDVSIDDGATNLMANNADGVATPGPMTFDTGDSSGDFWTLTTQSQHSGVNSMWNDHAGHYNLSNALVSPWYSIPTGTNVAFSFWLWCNMPDFDGDGNNSLEDYYHVEVSTDGVVWQAVFYDYGDITRPGGALVGWDSYDPGDPFNGNITMSLAAFGGQDIKLRFRVITDDNDDGGIGDGLYIDDVEIFTTGLNNDVGALNLDVPYPTSLYFATIPCSVELHNFGNLNQGLVPAAWRVNYGTPNPLIPWASIPMLSYVTKTWNWTTPAIGSYFMDAYTFMGSDEDLSNDTSKAGIIEVTAADVWEFGYDGREWTYEPSYYYFNAGVGEGAYVRYTPVDDGVTDPLVFSSLKALFNDAGTIRVRLYGPGATAPGAPIAAFNQAVTQIQPNWQTIDISSYNITGEFWVWYQVTAATGAPHIMGWDVNRFGDGNFFDNFNGFGPSDYSFFAHAIGGPATTPEFVVNLTYVSGSPVPAGGGNLIFDVYVLNDSGQSQDYDAWLATEYEGGAPTTLVMRSFVNYQAGWAINRPGMFYPVPG
ncbi:immune inhibitor A, partial [bacterium]|nr:immune inhibitor A [bacterium]